jgi:hypothetical protein
MRRAVKRYTVLLEFLIALGILPGCVWSVPTAGVMPRRGTGGWDETTPFCRNQPQATQTA